MSGHSDSCDCPNCGNAANSYTDWKPFDYNTIECLHCGLSMYPSIEYRSLKDLNINRKESGLRRLKKLPEQKSADDIWALK